MKILVTGGLGFIGSNFIRLALDTKPGWDITNLDYLTYAGKHENLGSHMRSPRYNFAFGSVADRDFVTSIVSHGFDAIINFAAETHVDRSIDDAGKFADTNLKGTANLLEAVKVFKVGKFIQISTDEVYGSLPESGLFTESTPLHPNNPYSASKAAADLMVLAFFHTFGINALITRASNNYGPRQYPEKLIPLTTSRILKRQQVPVYGDGMQIRDWLHVDDHCRGVIAALEKGRAGEVYNFGGGNELPNIVVVKQILDILEAPHSLISYVTDRLGHDRRYAIDSSKAREELGWRPEVDFGAGLHGTVNWYKNL